MVGCREDAELIQEWDHNFELPDGWHFFDSGDERDVFLSPDRTIYKVEKILGANSKEYFNICKIENMEPIENWRVPESSLYVIDTFHSVIAMEYIEGDSVIECASMLSISNGCTCEQFPCEGIQWETVSVLWGIIDLHRGNVKMLPDGTKVLVDVTR